MPELAPASPPCFRPCAVIPTFDNPKTVRKVAERVRAHISRVFVVDDGSGISGRTQCEALAIDGIAHVERRLQNGGKGAAVKTGFELARRDGFTHVLQVDADAQHDLSVIPRFLAAGSTQPEALVLAHPVYDASAPAARLIARRFTRFWVDLEVGPHRITDAMVGFRLYPLPAAMKAAAAGNRMDFDIEIAVRMVWAGVNVVNLPVAVHYPSRQDGGVSHFQPLRDNLRFVSLHSRLCTLAAVRSAKTLLRWRK
ncbi:MAG: glycosyltransferase family 2 protein [Nannocystaceae bacterium]